ncbi:hypothetical protein [uncultured Methanospirillum sp.]|uniref:hypothetical protein n=1 Tax=uncultured Methanospirillum sp. TaxID=262503 RepID=UPI0029C98929|nr:hypothetical protein [uncultured Methanospirillum sp.]
MSPSYTDIIGDLSLSNKGRDEECIVLDNVIFLKSIDENPVRIIDSDIVKPVVIRQ